MEDWLIFELTTLKNSKLKYFSNFVILLYEGQVTTHIQEYS